MDDTFSSLYSRKVIYQYGVNGLPLCIHYRQVIPGLPQPSLAGKVPITVNAVFNGSHAHASIWLVMSDCMAIIFGDDSHFSAHGEFPAMGFGRRLHL